MLTELTEEQKVALKENKGVVQGESFVILSLERYQEVLGAVSEEELQESLEAIEQAMKDMDEGRGVPLAEARRRIAEKHRLSS